MTKPHEPLPPAEATGEPCPPEVKAWLETPLAVHLARWKREIAEGLHDEEDLSDDEPTPRPAADSDHA